MFRYRVYVTAGAVMLCVLAGAAVVSGQAPVQYLLRQIIMEPKVSEEGRERIRARAQNCLDRANSGEDFTTLAKILSEEPGASQTGGDLGFFTREQMVKPFSDAVFSMSSGDIAGPVETQYGFHIIKLHAVRGDQRHAQHILFGLRPSHDDTLSVLKRLADARARIVGGESFDDVFADYNTNDLLASTAGYSVWQKPSDMLPSFAENIRGLGVGEITEPFQSIIGFHIVLVDSINHDPAHLLEGFPPGIEGDSR